MKNLLLILLFTSSHGLFASENGQITFSWNGTSPASMTYEGLTSNFAPSLTINYTDDFKMQEIMLALKGTGELLIDNATSKWLARVDDIESGSGTLETTLQAPPGSDAIIRTGEKVSIKVIAHRGIVNVSLTVGIPGFSSKPAQQTTPAATRMAD